MRLNRFIDIHEQSIIILVRTVREYREWIKERIARITK